MHITFAGNTNTPVTLRMVEGPHTLNDAPTPQDVFGIWTTYEVQGADDQPHTIALADYSDKTWADFTYMWGAKRWA